MKITVIMSSMTQFKQLVLDDETKKAKLNGEKIKIDIDDFASKILSIVSSWDARMVNEFIMDGQEYKVKIEKDEKTFEYYGKNKYPDNFKEFTTLLQENKII